VICHASKSEIVQPPSQEQISDILKFDNPPTREQLGHYILKYLLPSTFNLGRQSDALSRLKKIDYRNNVISLSLEYCGLESLPNEIEDFTNLFYLDLRGNGLKELPDWISKLSKLKYLDLSDNKLTKLPESLKNLSCLEIINLSNNKFPEYPSILWKINGCIPIIDIHPTEIPIK